MIIRNTRAVASVLVMSSLMISGVSRAGENPFSSDSDGVRSYASYSAEYFKWDETVDRQDSKFVSEHGPRFRTNFGANNYVDATGGLLKAWDMSVMFGVVSYRGGATDPKYKITSGSLKGDTFYTGYSADMTRGYRLRASENISFDVKGTLGAQAWMRNIRSDNVYIPAEDAERKFGAVEISLQPYAKAALGVNWQMTPDSKLNLEGGVLYPIRTWTHSNVAGAWLEPESRVSPFGSLTWNVTRDIFVKASYIYQKYGKSDPKKGKLNDHNAMFYQPATTTSTIGMEIGFYY